MVKISKQQEIEKLQNNRLFRQSNRSVKLFRKTGQIPAHPYSSNLQANFSFFQEDLSRETKERPSFILFKRICG
jgi:hypothetical protein